MDDLFLPYEIVWLPHNGELLESKLFFHQNLDRVELLIGNPYAFPEVKGLYIKVDEKTRQKDLIEDWKHIKRIRNQYYQRYGFDIGKYDPDLEALRLYKWRQLEGIWHAKLTYFLNYEASIYLYMIVKAEDPVIRDDAYYWLENMFITLNVENRFDNDVAKGSACIKRGDAPWDITGKPFSVNKVEDKIDTFENRLSSGELTLNDGWRNVSMILDN